MTRQKQLVILGLTEHTHTGVTTRGWAPFFESRGGVVSVMAMSRPIKKGY